MDHPNLLSSSTPLFPPKSHMRSASRSPTRPRLTDDILADLSPTTTLEAFTSASGTLKASIEAASPSQREFGVRAALASKKIQEWAAELSVWQWPANGSEGFENPVAKRRKLSHRAVEGSSNGRQPDLPSSMDTEEYWGCLPVHELIKYETRIDEVSQDMEDLDVEAIKSLVLDTHVQSRTRSSSFHSTPPALRSYTRMDDFTTVITATVLRALPSLARLTKLMDIWTVRLAILRQVPHLMAAMDDAETVLKSAWATIQTAALQTSSSERKATISRNDFEVIRDVLQDKVTTLGRKLDQMLDALEGREDTLPDEWIDRMESIEQNYGEWSVSAERKVREAAWVKEAAKRRQIEEAKKVSSSVSEQSNAPSDVSTNEAPKLAHPASTPVYNADSDNIHPLGDAREQTKPEKNSLPAPEIYNQPIIKTLLSNPNSSHLEGSRNPTLPQNSLNDSPRPNDGMRIKEMDLLPATTGQLGQTLAISRNEPSTSGVSSSAVLPARRRSPAAQEGMANLPPQLDGACFSAGPELMRLATSTPSSQNFRNKEPTARKEELKGSSVQVHDMGKSGSSERSFIDTMYSQQIQAPIPPFPLGSRMSTTMSSTSKNVDYIPNYSNGTSPPFQVPKYGHPLANTLRREAEERDSRISSSRSSSDRSDSIRVKERIKESVSPKISKAIKSEGTPEEAPQENQRRKTGEVSPRVDISQVSEAVPIIASPAKPSAGFDTAGKLEATDVVEVPKITEAHQKLSDDATQTSAESQKMPMISEKASIRRIAGDDKRMSLDALISPDIHATGSKDFASTSAPALPQTSHGDLYLTLPSPGATIPISTDYLTPSDNTSKVAKGHTRGPSTASAISGYASSEPSPEIKEAEPTEYFRPVSPPIMGKIERPETPDILTPTRATFIPLELQSRKSSIAAKDGSPSPKLISEGNSPTMDRVIRHSWTPSKTTKEEDSARERPGSSLSESRYRGSISPTTSIGFPQNVTQQMERQRQLSISSDSPSISEILLESSTRTPVKVSSQYSEIAYDLPSTDKKSSMSLTDYDEESPSLGRMRVYDDVEKYSAPNSPLPDLQAAKRRPSELSTSLSFDTDSLYPDSPMTPAEAPALGNIDVSPSRGLSYPSRPSDDQLQQQISEILESIPATKIRLATEPRTAKPSGIPKLMKKISRSSLSPVSRPTSRAPSPSFTLAPVYAKNPRPRPQNGNPEIKLYHLSRSTGEAPIKLFVRLVGEHGERVMVRVGGGWADLGEYLKEYASHHGRRTDKDGKVEIQDLPPRNVSMGSNVSTIRNGGGNASGRSSPISRPASSLERPLSSLAIRKTRKSVGEDSRSPGFRSPSTPLLHTFRSSPSVPRPTLETPPSSRSVSHSEWTEEESSLGLAGPKGRKVDISEKDAAWVESMKEKVRLASAEKEKKLMESTFGEMDRVGGTKRLFKKNMP